MKDKILDLLNKFNKEKSVKNIEFYVFDSKISSFGDYSTNMALKISRSWSIKTPKEIYEDFSYWLKSKKIDWIDKIEFVDGFINIFVNKQKTYKYFIENFEKLINLKMKDSKKINYEFISANPTGLLHVGHARNGVIGDVFCRLMKKFGFEVTREFYVNDFGNQIFEIIKSVKFAFENGVSKIEDFESEIKKTNCKILYKSAEVIELSGDDSVINCIKQNNDKKLKKIIVEYFMLKNMNTIKNLGIENFNVTTKESELLEDTSKIENYLKEWINKGIAKENEGAIWLKTNEKGDLKDRVLKKSLISNSDNNNEKTNSMYTYALGDLIYHCDKISRGYDKLINLWGVDHKGYDLRIKQGLEMIFDKKIDLEVDFVNLVYLSNFETSKTKMSKRLGTILTIDYVLDKVDFNLFRFFLISKQKEHDLVIDLDDITKKSTTNTYYYCQYAYARLTQLLEQSKPLTSDFSKLKIKAENIDDFEHTMVLKGMNFKNISKHALEVREPNVIINYLKELSAIFHSFYNKSRIFSKDLQKAFEKIKLLEKIKEIYNIIFEIIGIIPMEKI